MEIHGSDFLIQGTPPDQRTVIRIVREFWPDLVVENDDDESVDDGDYFIYKNQQAKDIWDQVGWTETDDADMIYVLFREDHMTVVIDDERRNMNIVEKIRGSVGNRKTTRT